jgi:hypothetical protein
MFWRDGTLADSMYVLLNVLDLLGIVALELLELLARKHAILFGLDAIQLPL